jgi:hypothetical protein
MPVSNKQQPAQLSPPRIDVYGSIFKLLSLVLAAIGIFISFYAVISTMTNTRIDELLSKQTMMVVEMNIMKQQLKELYDDYQSRNSNASEDLHQNSVPTVVNLEE